MVVSVIVVLITRGCDTEFQIEFFAFPSCVEVGHTPSRRESRDRVESEVA